MSELKMSEVERNIRASAVMDFVEMIRGAYSSGFIDNHPTNYDIYRSAQVHVKDRYGVITDIWDDELAKESRNDTHDKIIKENQRLATDRQNAIGLMSKSWQHDSEKQDDLITRYVTMAENQFKKKDEEIERLTAIATKHATRCDELYDALECICSYVSEDGLITTGLAKEIVNAQRLLNKSRTEADK